MHEIVCNVKNKTESISSFEDRAIRIIDFSIALVVLILALPLMALIAFVVKIDSHGPVLFKQIRMGKDRRNGTEKNGNGIVRERRQEDMCSRPFKFYKFRTMNVDARKRFPELYKYDYNENEINTLYFKIPDDPRLTRFGQHLRKTTLDELPNLINVIKGDMALVGPRPDIPEMIQYYNGWQKKKLRIRPGVTGLAQVNGRGLLSFQETLNYDVEMVEKYGFWFNLKVILKTIKVTFFRIGAF